MKEAIRYLENAKELLGKSPVDGSRYSDEKYVKSACGVAYLGVLKAIEESLLKKGLTKKELPKKVDRKNMGHSPYYIYRFVTTASSCLTINPLP